MAPGGTGPAVGNIEPSGQVTVGMQAWGLRRKTAKGQVVGPRRGLRESSPC